MVILVARAYGHYTSRRDRAVDATRLVCLFIWGESRTRRHEHDTVTPFVGSDDDGAGVHVGVHSGLRAETCGGAMRAFRAPATIAPRARSRRWRGSVSSELLSRASSTSSSGSSDDDALEAKRRYVNVTGFHSR